MLDGYFYAFIRKEAVVPSQTEGTQATLVHLLTFEAQEDSAGKGAFDATAKAELEEVCNDLAAPRCWRCAGCI